MRRGRGGVSRSGGDSRVGQLRDGWLRQGGYCITLKPFGTGPNDILSYDLVLEYQYPIFIMIGVHGGRLDRER